MKNYLIYLSKTSLLLLYSFSLFSMENKRELMDSLCIEETIEQIMERDIQEDAELIIRPKHLIPSLELQDNKSLLKKELYYDESISHNDSIIRSPQNVSLNFTSITLSDTFALPPDSDGGVGPSQYLTVVNGRIRSHSKFTGAADGIINTSLSNFFNSVRNGAGTTDPRVKYDRLTSRWFVLCINVQSGSNRILLAVSNSSILTAGTVWSFFFLDQASVNPAGDAGLFFDFPTFGIDNNALYIGGNLFDSNDFYINSSVFVIQKSSAISGGPLVATAFRNFVNTGGPVTPQGVTNFDTSATQGFFLGSFNNTILSLRIISNPGSTTPTISSAILISIPTVAFPPDVPSSGSVNLLDSIDTRLAEPHIRNNQLWVTLNIGVDNTGSSTGTISRTGCRWYQFNLTNPLSPALVQSGTLFDSAATNPTFYWMPSIMTSGQGHMALGFSVAGATQFANAGTVGRLVNNATGTLGTPVLYTASSTAYNVQSGTQRWGDYSITSIDPDDNMTMWTIQEFCNATNSYGCQVAKLLAPVPAAVSSATPPIAARGLSSVNITINGTTINGSGFYDPGVGFANHISSQISGGVVVNSVTYISPTSVVININTQFATTGVKNVIVRNPDDQISSGNVLIII